jgi:hypothetical protein
MNKATCPIHGTKFMIREGTAKCSPYYCNFPTPNERFSRCFYHSSGRSKVIVKEDTDHSKPDVMKAIFTNSDKFWLRKVQIKKAQGYAKF